MKNAFRLSNTALFAGLASLGLAARSVLRSLRRKELRGQTVVITGGSRGLGLALARQLAAKGCRLAICARDPGELERVRTELAASGTEVLVAACDVTKQTQVDRFIRQVIAHFGSIDVLIANAATIQVGPLTTMTKRDFEMAMDAIFWGSYYPTMAVLTEMRRKGTGSIVHISSIGGKIPVPHLAPYTAAKFALTGFSEAARAELKKEGISVTTVIPGLMRTGSHLNVEYKGQAEKEFAWFSLSLLSPLLSISADRAARSIIDAIELNKAQVILSLPAKLGALLHGIAPGLFADLMAMQNGGLPEDDGHGQKAVRGMDVRHRAPGSSVIAYGEEDARRYNQFPGPFGGQRTRGQA